MLEDIQRLQNLIEEIDSDQRLRRKSADPKSTKGKDIAGGGGGGRSAIFVRH